MQLIDENHNEGWTYFLFAEKNKAPNFGIVVDRYCDGKLCAYHWVSENIRRDSDMTGIEFEIKSGLNRLEVRHTSKTTQITVAAVGVGLASIELDYTLLEDLVIGIMAADPKNMSGPRALMALHDIREGRQPVGTTTACNQPKLVVDN